MRNHERGRDNADAGPGLPAFLAFRIDAQLVQFELAADHGGQVGEGAQLILEQQPAGLLAKDSQHADDAARLRHARVRRP